MIEQIIDNSDLWQGLYELIIQVLKGIALLIGGWLLANFACGMARRFVARYPKIDPTVGNFFASSARWVILAFVITAVLNVFGIQAASIIAVMGAATLAIGLALQGTLSDVAAGVLLVVFRPYRVGQYVDIGGAAGTVIEINLFLTELVTPQNVHITLPNGQAWGAVVTNYGHYPKRRLDLEVGISYDDDIDAAMDSLRTVFTAEERIHSDPEPWIKVKNLGSSSVDLGIRVWCDTDDVWDLHFDLLKSIKQRFDADGITIPYPHHVQINQNKE